ncbi:hypothetical protein HZB02_05735 [Candidatus Woesearchaeota archaeon]|nr:hypothetical protein [Candidatus Woesearchaeota archaeon]
MAWLTKTVRTELPLLMSNLNVEQPTMIIAEELTTNLLMRVRNEGAKRAGVAGLGMLVLSLASKVVGTDDTSVSEIYMAGTLLCYTAAVYYLTSTLSFMSQKEKLIEKTYALLEESQLNDIYER